MRTVTACAAVLFMTASVHAATPTFYNSVANFTAAVGTQIVDGYDSPPYGAGFNIYGNAAMSAFLGETDYETTGHSNLNIVTSSTYCAGCNGSFRLIFTSTSVTVGGGVFGAGVDVTSHETSQLLYQAFITYGDSTTQDVAMPAAGSFWGVTAPEGIVSIHFGLAGGGGTTSGSFQIGTLRIAAAPSGSGADLSLSQTESTDPATAGSGAGNLTYVVTVTNQGPANATGVVIDEDLTLPAGVTVESVTPSVGSFATTTAPDGDWTVGSLTNGANATLTIVLTVGASTAPGDDVIRSRASVQALNETDPDSSDDAIENRTTVIAPTDVTATKTVVGGTWPGSEVTYTMTISNAGPADAVDDAAVDEFTDVLPASLLLTGAQVISGGGTVATNANTVTWNGPIPAGGTVVLEITARIAGGTEEGQPVTNQGQLLVDVDGDGDNDSARLTDDPGVGGAADPTEFRVGALAVPALGLAGLMLLAGLLALLGALVVRRSA